jgi:hypothetical protein
MPKLKERISIKHNHQVNRNLLVKGYRSNCLWSRDMCAQIKFRTLTNSFYLFLCEARIMTLPTRL